MISADGDTGRTTRLPGSFTCYRCGQRFDNRFKHRRKVQTGWSIGRSFRAYYRTVNLCPECNQEHIRRERIKTMITAAVVLVIIAVIALW